MGPPFIHDEMMMGPFLCKSCSDSCSYSELNSPDLFLNVTTFSMLCDQKIYFIYFQFFKDLFQSSNSGPFILKYHSGQMALLLRNSGHIGKPGVIKYKQSCILYEPHQVLRNCLSSLSFLLYLKIQKNQEAELPCQKLWCHFQDSREKMARQPAPVS